MADIHNPALQACTILGPVLDQLNVSYALMGGAACAALGSGRATKDVDLCIVATNQLNADSLSITLRRHPLFTEVDEDGVGVFVPAVILPDGSHVAVEIFDAGTWPERPQYQHVQTDAIQARLSNGTTVSLFSPQWQLREKIAAAQQRGHPGTLKATTDVADVVFLCSIIPQAQYQTGLLVFSTAQYIEAFKGFLKRPDVDPAVFSLLLQIIKVEA